MRPMRITKEVNQDHTIWYRYSAYGEYTILLRVPAVKPSRHEPQRLHHLNRRTTLQWHHLKHIIRMVRIGCNPYEWQ